MAFEVLTRLMISICAFPKALMASSNSVAHVVSAGGFASLLMSSFFVGVVSPLLFVFVSLTMMISFLSFSCVFFMVMVVSRLSVLLIFFGCVGAVVGFVGGLGGVSCLQQPLLST